MARINLPGYLSGQYAPAKSLGTPGYVPDYKSLILSDPTYRQTAANLSAQGVQAGTTRDQGLQSDLVNYGQVPSAQQLGLNPGSALYKALQGAVTPGITAAAQNNPFSTTAANAYDHTVNLGKNLASIGARAGDGGMLQTSDLGVADSLENHRYGQQAYDATHQLLSHLAGLQQAFTGQQTAAAGTLANAATAATGRVAALNPTIQGTGALSGMTLPRIAPGLNLPGGPSAPTAGSHGAAL